MSFFHSAVLFLNCIISDHIVLFIMQIVMIYRRVVKCDVFKFQIATNPTINFDYNLLYPVRLRRGRHAEEGFGGKLRVPPSIK